MDIPDDIKKKVDDDIECLKEAIADFNNSSTPEFAKSELCQDIGNYYDSIIPTFGNGVLGFYEEGHIYTEVGGTSLHKNLRTLKSKLESFKDSGYKSPVLTQSSSSPININPTFQNTNSNQITFNISFMEAKRIIEDMPGLTAPDTAEILSKIDEIKALVGSPEHKKTKWEKAKPIIKWIADKSVDVGITLLPLLLNIK